MAGHVIETFYAFVVIDADGDEGLIAHQHPNGAWMPLVCSDRARLEDWRELARLTALQQRVQVRVYKWSGPRELLEIIDGRSKGTS
jgi:hypothetical protein